MPYKEVIKAVKCGNKIVLLSECIKCNKNTGVIFQDKIFCSKNKLATKTEIENIFDQTKGMIEFGEIK